jgi:hypothetical protein
VNKMLKDMNGRKIAEESSCPWSSSVLFVMKKNGYLRSCVDYRRLNPVTKKDWFSVTKTDDTLHTCTIAAAKEFSTLDLKSRYGRITRSPVTGIRQHSTLYRTGAMSVHFYILWPT